MRRRNAEKDAAGFIGTNLTIELAKNAYFVRR
jgi:hypothetical protein